MVAIDYILFSIDNVSEPAQEVGRNCLTKMHEMYLLFITFQKAWRTILLMSHQTEMFTTCLLSRRLCLNYLHENITCFTARRDARLSVSSEPYDAKWSKKQWKGSKVRIKYPGTLSRTNWQIIVGKHVCVSVGLRSTDCNILRRNNFLNKILHCARFKYKNLKNISYENNLDKKFETSFNKITFTFLMLKIIIYTIYCTLY